MGSGSETVQINPLYWWSFVNARHARRQGDYRQQSLHHFARAWESSGHIDDLLAYALFRRDLGKILPRRWCGYIADNLQQLSSQRRLLAVNLLLEADSGCVDITLFRALPESRTIQAPAILFYLSEVAAYRLECWQQKLADIFVQQNHWQSELQTKLAMQAGQQGICVVGNAGCMRGSLLGEVIDQKGCVVRFNTFTSNRTDSADMGQRHDIWVVTPSFKTEQVPADFSGHIVLTGPDMQYRMLDWSGMQIFRDHDLPLLPMPLVIWRVMVCELAAPPSAGILFLAWLKSLLGSWHGVSVAGFGALADNDAVYHHTDAKHQPSSRHNWAGEAVILRRWQNEGLQSLHG